MPKAKKRERGGQKNNQNARTHGFYSKVLDETEKAYLTQAVEVDGLDSEIAILRVKIMSLLEKDPHNTELILQAVRTLSRLVRDRSLIKRNQKKSLKEEIGDVLKNVALPIGVGVGQGITR
ncbi:MAG: hypothetical protein HYX79_09700 [Chloroflexi bacterium]|nr:hypothetical protein [Chloroflexota bacterium]